MSNVKAARGHALVVYIHVSSHVLITITKASVYCVTSIRLWELTKIHISTAQLRNQMKSVYTKVTVLHAKN